MSLVLNYRSWGTQNFFEQSYPNLEVMSDLVGDFELTSASVVIVIHFKTKLNLISGFNAKL